MERGALVPTDPGMTLARLMNGDTVTEQELIPDSHRAILNAIIDKEPKFRVTPDTADGMDIIDWVARINEELRIVRTDEDENNVFRALHQIRYLSTQAMLAQTRKDLARVA